MRHDAMGRSPTAASVIELLALHIGAAPQAGRPRIGVNRAPTPSCPHAAGCGRCNATETAGVERRTLYTTVGSGDGRIVISRREAEA